MRTPPSSVVELVSVSSPDPHMGGRQVRRSWISREPALWLEHCAAATASERALGVSCACPARGLWVLLPPARLVVDWPCASVRSESSMDTIQGALLGINRSVSPSYCLWSNAALERPVAGEHSFRPASFANHLLVSLGMLGRTRGPASLSWMRMPSSSAIESVMFLHRAAVRRSWIS